MRGTIVRLAGLAVNVIGTGVSANTTLFSTGYTLSNARYVSSLYAANIGTTTPLLLQFQTNGTVSSSVAIPATAGQISVDSVTVTV
jgi:hypothetical protein